MKREVKKRIIDRISESLSLNKLSNMLTENGDQYILSIRQSDIPGGIEAVHMNRIINTSTFVCMKIGQFNVIFVFNIAEDPPIV